MYFCYAPLSNIRRKIADVGHLLWHSFNRTDYFKNLKNQKQKKQRRRQANHVTCQILYLLSIFLHITIALSFSLSPRKPQPFNQINWWKQKQFQKTQNPIFPLTIFLLKSLSYICICVALAICFGLCLFGSFLCSGRVSFDLFWVSEWVR